MVVCFSLFNVSLLTRLLCSRHIVCQFKTFMDFNEHATPALLLKKSDIAPLSVSSLAFHYKCITTTRGLSERLLQNADMCSSSSSLFRLQTCIQVIHNRFQLVSLFMHLLLKEWGVSSCRWPFCVAVLHIRSVFGVSGMSWDGACVRTVCDMVFFLLYIYIYIYIYPLLCVCWRKG